MDKASTYTLTNVVPQIREFSTGPWAKHKETLRRRLNNYCRGTVRLFRLTGFTDSSQLLARSNSNPDIIRRESLPSQSSAA